MPVCPQVDMDGNGSTDLIVSAPGIMGCVYVVLGEVLSRCHSLARD